MAQSKDVLVITSSSIEGYKVKKYLKPVTAHIVAGTNLFSDFLGGLTDVFGGRSNAYQKQLQSLYNEAIEQVKYAAYQLGGNCIIGLSIDMDEISGKGKSMFMLTAIGTAIVIDEEYNHKSNLPNTDDNFEIVSLEKLDYLRNKKKIIELANSDTLVLDESTWDFIITNQIDEVSQFLMKTFSFLVSKDLEFPESTKTTFFKWHFSYIESLQEKNKIDLLYNAIKVEPNDVTAFKLSKIIDELNLFDFNRIMELLNDNSFQIQKRGLLIATYDKIFYNKKDIEDLKNIKDFIQAIFKERGTRSMTKQLLSKEKEIWTCECKATNDIGTYCNSCFKSIHGFKKNEMGPFEAIDIISRKIELIAENLV
jgi:uncharacterized protein YbjQ (UPF0145 family)